MGCWGWGMQGAPSSLSPPTQARGIQSVLNLLQLARRLHSLGLAVVTQDMQVPGYAS